MIRPQSLFGPQQKPSTLEEPLDHLLACHRRIEERLGVMERAAAHLNGRRDEALEAFQNAFRFMESSGALHTADEEESLFPRLLPLLDDEGRSYLAGLERDHAEADRLYARLRTAVAAAGADSASQPEIERCVARLTRLYRRHIASEDKVLQVYARQHLTPAQLEAIAAEMRKRRGV